MIVSIHVVCEGMAVIIIHVRGGPGGNFVERSVMVEVEREERIFEVTLK